MNKSFILFMTVEKFNTKTRGSPINNKKIIDKQAYFTYLLRRRNKPLKNSMINNRIARIGGIFRLLNSMMIPGI